MNIGLCPPTRVCAHNDEYCGEKRLKVGVTRSYVGFGRGVGRIGVNPLVCDDNLHLAVSLCSRLVFCPFDDH